MGRSQDSVGFDYFRDITTQRNPTARLGVSNLSTIGGQGHGRCQRGAGSEYRGLTPLLSRNHADTQNKKVNFPFQKIGGFPSPSELRELIDSRPIAELRGYVRAYLKLLDCGGAF